MLIKWINWKIAKDYYKLLNIKYPSNQKEIKSQFFKLAKDHHPDVSDS